MYYNFKIPQARGFENELSIVDNRRLNLNPGQMQMPGPLGQTAIINEPNAQWIQGRSPYPDQNVINSVLGGGPEQQRRQSEIFNGLRYGSKQRFFQQLHQPVHSGTPMTNEIPYYESGYFNNQ